MNRYKSKNYKSAVQTFNTTAQPIVATDIDTSPVVIALGTKVTDTGVAIDYESNGVDIEASGLYRFSANIDVLGVTAGDVAFAFTMNGQVLPESLATITAVAEISELVAIETIRAINLCCAVSDANIGIIAYSDGTGAATIERISFNAVKLA